MKTVFSSNYDVIHAFAQQNQYEGRNQTQSVFFYNNKIYSYGHHYLLGEFIDKNTIVINNKGYSNSTSKHISILIGATRQYKQYFLTMNKIVQTIDKVSKIGTLIMGVFLPLYILFHLIFKA